MITKHIGKNTLGDNNKMKVNLRTYNRSTHNLSYVWRNTQAVGTLIPFMSIPMMKGDTFEINLQPNVMTHPTIGPLFGSFKMQNDIFFCPIRLYNSWLHNNKLKIGLNMSQIKLPQIKLLCYPTRGDEETQYNVNQPSSLVAYLGITANGKNKTNTAQIMRSYNAVPIIAYYDIFKNYYANKQEEKFYLMNYENQITSVTAMTTPSGGSQLWNTTNPNRINKELPDEKNNTLQIKLLKELDQNEFEALCTITVNIDNSTAGITKTKTTKVPLTQYYKFYGYTPATKTYLYTWKDEKPLPNSPKIFAIEARQGKIQACTLDDIDDLREDILKKAGNLTYYLNGDKDQTTPPTFAFLNLQGSGLEGGWANNYFAPEWGITVKTYQSDLCQNWINTEWLDGENGINQITAVDVSDGSFTIDALNLANKVYNMLNRIAISDGSYRSWLETVYTEGYAERTETPIYCGGSSAEVVFQEVISQSATADEPLGTLAGRGMDSNHKGGHVIVRATEPGYLIGITSLTPRLDYTQGNQWDVNLISIDDLHKPALDGIGFQDLDAELLDARCSVVNTDGSISRTFVGKQPAWINYMTNINKAYGNFRTNENFMILSRQYEMDDDKGKIADMTTYIDPTLYNNIFADQSFDAQNFWVQIGVNIKARRLMSAKIIPNL
nr:MAG TPA: Major capsid protein [Microviridae sp.]